MALAKAKNTILTPIKVTETKMDQNIQVLLQFVEHNWNALVVGCERGMEHDSNIIRQPNKVVYGSIEFHWTSNAACFIKIYNYGSEIKTDSDIKACLYALDMLREHAENPRGFSRYSLELESAPTTVTYSNMEDIF
jgi:hypothetical protein